MEISGTLYDIEQAFLSDGRSVKMVVR